MVRTFTKKHIFRRSFENQHFKGSQTLVKSSWEGSYNIFQTLCGEMILKTSPWSMFQITGVFVKTHGLPATSILFWSVRIWRSLLKRNYLEKKKYFLSFFFNLWNLHQILDIFKKNETLIANVFPKLTTV